MRFNLLAASAVICLSSCVSAQYDSSYGTDEDTTSFFWTVTQYVVSTTSVYDLTTRTMTYDAEVTMVPEYTPPADAGIYDSYTYDDYYEDYRMIQLTLDSTVSVPASMIQTDIAYDSEDYTYYVLLQTFTAPASCSKDFTWVLPYSRSLPNEVRNLVTPTSTSTSTFFGYASGDTVTYLYVSDADVPSPTPPHEYTRYIARCSTPYTGYQVDESGVPVSTATAYPTSYGYGGDDDDDDDDDDDSVGAALATASGFASSFQEQLGRSAAFWKLCKSVESQDALKEAINDGSIDGLCFNLKPWVIAIAVIFPLFFVFGFVESFFWHYRLMSGCWALRLGTISWILICPWIILYTRISKDVSDAEKEYLLAKRTDMNFGQMVGHWLKWGFAWEHPLNQLSAEEKQNLAVARTEPVADVPAVPDTREATAPGAAPSPSTGTPVSPITEDGEPSSSRAIQHDEITPATPGPSAH